jgi:hypothetical protein
LFAHVQTSSAVNDVPESREDATVFHVVCALFARLRHICVKLLFPSSGCGYSRGASAFHHNSVLCACPTNFFHLTSYHHEPDCNSLNLFAHASMARYTVNVAAGDRRASLLVVLSPSQLCSALLNTVKSRLPPLSSKLGITDAKNARVTLHLNAEDRPMLNLEDLLSDCLPDPKEVVYAVIDVSHATNSVYSNILANSDIQTEQALLTSPHLPVQSTSGGLTLRVRVITPESAQTDNNAITPLPAHVPVSTT